LLHKVNEKSKTSVTRESQNKMSGCLKQNQVKYVSKELWQHFFI